MAQRAVEILIGRLITDEGFRTAFLADAAGTLAELCERGFDLTSLEIAALVESDRTLWDDAAERLDRRLQKASLINTVTSQKAS